MAKVAFLGKLGSGKTTAAKFLEEQGYIKVSQSKEFRPFVDKLVSRGDRRHRELLVMVAEGVRSIMGETFWIDRAILEAGIWEKEGLSLVLDDARRPWEVRRLLEEGWVVIGIEADEDKRVQLKAAQDGITEEQARERLNDQTEQDVDEAIMIAGVALIKNAGTKQEFKELVLKTVDREVDGFTVESLGPDFN